MLTYTRGEHSLYYFADRKLNLEDVSAMLATLAADAVIDVSDFYACIGARTIKHLVPEATATSFGIDCGSYDLPDSTGGAHVIVYGEIEVQNLIMKLIDISVERDGVDEPESNFTVAEIRDQIALMRAWRQLATMPL